MKKRSHLHNLWLILAVYGIWFALFSGAEEMLNGKYWKVIASLALGIVIYLAIEGKSKD